MCFLLEESFEPLPESFSTFGSDVVFRAGRKRRTRDVHVVIAGSIRLPGKCFAHTRRPGLLYLFLLGLGSGFLTFPFGKGQSSARFEFGRALSARRIEAGLECVAMKLVDAELFLALAKAFGHVVIDSLRLLRWVDGDFRFEENPLSHRDRDFIALANALHLLAYFLD